MNFVLIDQAKEVGGGQVIFATLIRAFLFLDPSSKVLCFFPRSELKNYLFSQDKIKKESVEVKEMNFSPFSFGMFFANCELFVSLMKTAKDAFCVLNGLRYLPAVALYSRIRKKNVVVYVHSNQSDFRWSFYKIFLKISFSVEMVFVSEYSKNATPGSIKNNLKNIRFHVLENCVERLEKPSFSSIPVVGFCGQKSFNKGYDLFVSLALKNPGLKFVSVGPAHDVNDSGLDNLVSYGFSPTPREVLSSEGVSILIVPTRLPETFCMVAAEGFLDNRYVIARRIGYMASSECDYIDCIVDDDLGFDMALKNSVEKVAAGAGFKRLKGSDRFSFSAFSENLAKILASR